MSRSLTSRGARMLLRAGIIGCLVTAAIVLGADVSEYPSLNRAGVRALTRGALPLLCLGVINLAALDAPDRPWRAGITWLAVVGNLALLAWVARFVGTGGPPIIWVLGGTSVLLLAGSVGCAVARRSPPA